MPNCIYLLLNVAVEPVFGLVTTVTLDVEASLSSKWVFTDELCFSVMVSVSPASSSFSGSSKAGLRFKMLGQLHIL